MLILTRRVQQRIRIGSDVIVTILELKGSQVRVGIEAPRAIGVHREEAVQVYEAAASSPSKRATTMAGS